MRNMQRVEGENSRGGGTRREAITGLRIARGGTLAAFFFSPMTRMSASLHGAHTDPIDRSRPLVRVRGRVALLYEKLRSANGRHRSYTCLDDSRMI